MYQPYPFHRLLRHLLNFQIVYIFVGHSIHRHSLGRPSFTYFETYKTKLNKILAICFHRKKLKSTKTSARGPSQIAGSTMCSYPHKLNHNKWDMLGIFYYATSFSQLKHFQSVYCFISITYLNYTTTMYLHPMVYVPKNCLIYYSDKDRYIL